VDLHQPALHAGALEGAVRGGGLDRQTGHLSYRTSEGEGEWQGEVRVVENVEETATQFELHALGDGKALVNVHVRVKVAQTTEAVTPNVSIIRGVNPGEIG